MIGGDRQVGIAAAASISYDRGVTGTKGPARYPPISDYAMIGDSRACALVSLAGSIDWLCLPDFDGPSFFGRLLDWDRGGHFQIVPEAPFEAQRSYIDDTNVLRTVFQTAGGEVSLIDFLPAETEREKRRALEPLRSVMRIVEGRAGRVAMRLAYLPRPGYAAGAVDMHARSAYEITSARGRHTTHLRSEVPLICTPRDAHASFEVRAGARVRFSLAYSLGEPAVIVSDSFVDLAYERTLTFWRRWCERIRYRGPYGDQVRRSALVLKLLAYAPSGAIAAAATTSLPERIGGERNWDYRYCWIRDAALTVKAFLALGLTDEATAFMGWLMSATNQTAPRLAPLYTLHGELRAPERTLDAFEGYRGSRPVRIGNAAANQEQFDVYGELVDAFDCYVEDQVANVSADEARLVSGIADYVARRWQQPDNGIWEARVEKRHYTHSKVMAWNALNHAVRLADAGVLRRDPGVWQRAAEAVRDTVLHRGFNVEVGAFTQTLDGAELDASVLMMPLVGFIEADDPRMLGTIDRLRERLDVNGFLLRYDGDDGLSAGEGTFLACNFWLAAALAGARRIDDARAVFERTAKAANDVGLLAEQFDARTGQALGNFPQGLSHLSLITAALAISLAEGRPTQ